MGTASNPGPYDGTKIARPDEPRFVLLGRDPQAPDLVRRWADDRETLGTDPERVVEARRVASSMDDWRVAQTADAMLGESSGDEPAKRPRTVPSPPVDRSQQVLVSGDPVPEDRSHLELKENGQQRDYVVLSPEERARGFVRPIRDSYVHAGLGAEFAGSVLVKKGEGGCGVVTTMSRPLAETYARDPKFYQGTFCVGCGKHVDLDQVFWCDDGTMVGS